MTKSSEQVRAVIAATFEIGPDLVRDDSSNQTIEKWDSIGHINLMMALEQQLGLSFTTEEILQTKDFQSICQLVARKSAAASIK